MAFEAKYENLIALTDVPRLLPRRHGKHYHLATIYRWVRHGVRGRKLLVVMIGGVAYCTPQSLDDFLSGQSTSGNATKPSPAM